MQHSASSLSKSDLILLMETMEKIEKIDKKGDYFDIIPKLNNLIPFGVFSHALLECKRNDQGILKVIDTFQVGSYPEEWAKRYAKYDYALIDPIVTQNVLNGSRYQRWKDTYEIIHPPKKFKMEADDFGLQDGVTIGGVSVRRPEFSLFCLSGKEMEHNDRTQYITERLINHLHQAIKRVRISDLKTELTDQQKDVLHYLKLGMPQKNIADELRLGPDRIKGIIAEIKNMLDSENAIHSVFMTMKQGDI